MCRLAAYRGPPRSVQALWLDPPHNLVVQSYAPREMNGALLNADGFGMAWYTSAAPTPALYRTVLPLWGDENVPRMAPHLVTECAIANVRSATPGMGIQTSNVSPFVEGRWAFTHNGVIRGCRGPLGRRLRGMLDDTRYAGIEGNTDSELLFALVSMHLARSGHDPAAALRAALDDVASEVRDASSTALLNVVLTDGRWLIAARHAVGAPAPSLYVRTSDALEIASEPLDASGWDTVPPGTLLVAAPGEPARREAL
jgi:glutamine amidotransferase